MKDWCKVNKCNFNKRSIKTCVSFFWWCPGPSAPRATYSMVSYCLCSSTSNARGESRALKGRCVGSKSPSRVRDRHEEVAGRNGREKFFPDRGHWFVTKGKQKKLSSWQISPWTAVPALTGTPRARSRKLGGSPPRPSLPGLQTQTRFWSPVFCLLFLYMYQALWSYYVTEPKKVTFRVFSLNFEFSG